MSKPSSTNYSKAYKSITLSIHLFFWCLLRRGSPLPIPNRVVKPDSADGTTVTRGRVCRRQFSKSLRFVWGFLFLYLFPRRAPYRCAHGMDICNPRFAEITVSHMSTPIFEKPQIRLGLFVFKTIPHMLEADPILCYMDHFP
jgi:hypothetical protein